MQDSAGVNQGSDCLGTASNPTAGWPAVPSGSGRFLLLETMTTARNRRGGRPAAGFAVAPYKWPMASKFW